MNTTPPRQPPRFVPTLTQVVQVPLSESGPAVQAEAEPQQTLPTATEHAAPENLSTPLLSPEMAAELDELLCAVQEIQRIRVEFPDGATVENNRRARRSKSLATTLPVDGGRQQQRPHAEKQEVAVDKKPTTSKALEERVRSRERYFNSP